VDATDALFDDCKGLYGARDGANDDADDDVSVNDDELPSEPTDFLSYEDDAFDDKS
jgi:hypothetical protein